MTTARHSFAGLLAPIIVLVACAAGAQELKLVSRQSDGGAQGNLESGSPSIGPNGDRVAFESNSTNLIPGGGLDGNGTSDVFLWNRAAGGVVELVSQKNGGQGNDGSGSPSISVGGHVAFESLATDLISDDGPDLNGAVSDIFFSLSLPPVRLNELVSRQDYADGGAQGNGPSGNPSVSFDGLSVAFQSAATNLIPGGGLDANGTDEDVFVFDRFTGRLELVSRQSATDGGAQGNADSFNPSISADGRFVAFQSGATNLIPGIEANVTVSRIFVFDRLTNALELVSRQADADGGKPGNSHSFRPAISADGRFVAFESRSTNLIPTGDANGGSSDIFVFDRTTDTLDLVSRQATADGGAQGNSLSFDPSISADGRFVAFASFASNLIPGGGADENTGPDVFVFDRTTRGLELVSRQAPADGGAQANAGSGRPSISADGRSVAFVTFATNLIPGGAVDANGTASDVLVWRRVPPPTGPDLIVAPLVFQTTTITGEDFQFMMSISNQGIGTSEATALRYYLSSDATITASDTEIGVDSVAPIGPGEQSLQGGVAAALTSEGTFWFGACIDGVTGEADSSNNCSYPIPITVSTPEPDLRVAILSIDRTVAPGVDNAQKISALVVNRGNVPSEATALRYFLSSDDTITISDTEIEANPIEPIGPSDQSSLQSTVFSAPRGEGTLWIGACVDPVAGEVNTSDNCSPAVALTLAPRPRAMPWLSLLLGDE